LLENLDTLGIHHTDSDDEVEASIDDEGEVWVDEGSEEDIDMQ
jgi:hypothetical protein